MQIFGLLWLVGFGVFLAGLLHDAAFRHRYREKYGQERYPLGAIADRYIKSPWRWPVEAPGVVLGLLRISVAQVEDPELEAMRVRARRWYGVGVALQLVAIAAIIGSFLLRVE